MSERINWKPVAICDDVDRLRWLCAIIDHCSNSAIRVARTLLVDDKPSIREISDEIRMTDTTAIRGIRELQRRGFLTVHFNAGRGLTNEYVPHNRARILEDAS